MIRLLYTFFIIIFLIAIIKKTTRSLHMLQQNLYNENNRYLKWIGKNVKDFINVEIIGVILSLYTLLKIYSETKYTNIIILVLILVYMFSFATILKMESKNQNKKPLVYTARVKRLLVTISII